jgi:hypothetical protein
MASYTQVQEALAQGVEPSLICSTCPWSRPCIEPPEMTKSEIDKKLEEAQEQNEAVMKRTLGDDDDHVEGRALGSLMGTLMTTMLFAGKDTQATVCPVFVTRMQGSEGRKIADSIRSQMRAWDDSEVTL